MEYRSKRGESPDVIAIDCSPSPKRAHYINYPTVNPNRDDCKAFGSSRALGLFRGHANYAIEVEDSEASDFDEERPLSSTKTDVKKDKKFHGIEYVEELSDSDGIVEETSRKAFVSAVPLAATLAASAAKLKSTPVALQGGSIFTPQAPGYMSCDRVSPPRAAITRLMGTESAVLKPTMTGSNRRLSSIPSSSDVRSSLGDDVDEETRNLILALTKENEEQQKKSQQEMVGRRYHCDLWYSNIPSLVCQ